MADYTAEQVVEFFERFGRGAQNSEIEAEGEKAGEILMGAIGDSDVLQQAITVSVLMASMDLPRGVAAAFAAGFYGGVKFAQQRSEVERLERLVEE